MHSTRAYWFPLAALLLVAACSSDESATPTPRLAKATVETGAMDALTKKVGQPSPQITCPGDMPATVGASMVCSVPLTMGTYDVTVTVTAVNGTVASFDVQVATMPRP